LLPVLCRVAICALVAFGVFLLVRRRRAVKGTGVAPSANGQHAAKSEPRLPAPLAVNPELVAEVQYLGLAAMSAFGEGANADWSPDGQRVAFLRNAETTGFMDRGAQRTVFSVQGTGLWLARSDGSDQRPLAQCVGSRSVSEMGWPTHPRWSPDGRSLACLFGQMLGGRVVILNVATGKPAELDYAATGLRWAPDGQSLAIVGCKQEVFPRPDGQLHVAVVGVRGQSFRSMAEVAHAELGDWSPDGTQLLYTTWERPAAYEEEVRARMDESRREGSALWVAKLDGSAACRVATHAAGRGIWSPDGHWIAYRGDKAEPGLWRIALATQEREPVIQGPVRLAQWARGGTVLFYLQDAGGRGTDLYLLRARDGQKQQITTSGNVVEALASPDGRHVVALAVDQAANAPYRDTYLLALKGNAAP